VPRLFTYLAAAAVCFTQAASTIAHAEDEPLTIASVASSGQSHLPVWVQTVVAHAVLYRADSDGDQVITTFTRHAFLRVVDGGTSRLEVQAYDAAGAPAQTGWIDVDDVEPSAPAINWLVNSAATTLWSADDASASVLRTLDNFTPLQKIDGPVLNRIQVRVYRADFSGVVGQGWVDASATGPAPTRAWPTRWSITTSFWPARRATRRPCRLPTTRSNSPRRLPRMATAPIWNTPTS